MHLTLTLNFVHRNTRKPTVDFVPRKVSCIRIITLITMLFGLRWAPTGVLAIYAVLI